MSFRYKYSIAASILCSAMVAVFWGANITAVYPFVQVVFQGQTLHDWIDGEVARAQAQVDAVAEATDSEGKGQSKADLQQKLARYELGREYVRRYAPSTAFGTLLAIVAFLMIGTAIKCVFRIASLVFISRASGRTSVDIRALFFRSILADRPQVDRGAGDAAARIGGDIGAIGTAIQTLFGRTVQEPLKMGACLLGAALFNWRLLLFSMLACPLASILLLSLARSIRRASLRAFDQKCLLIARMMQTFQGLDVVKAYNMESHERRRFWQHSLAVYHEQMKITFYGGLIRANNEMLGIGVVCLSAVAGGYLVLNQRTDLLGIPLAASPMNVGQIMTFYGFLIGCTDPLRKMADVYGSVQAGAAAADRIMPFLHTESARIAKPAEVRIRSARQPLIFEDVHFHYVPRNPVLRGVSFRVEVGETIAVVGANGAGKTTLINLLLRFQDPVKGQIRLGDIPLQDIRRKDLRRRIALVTQRPVLFSESVIDNIRYGSRRASTERVMEAAKKAHAHEFIVERLAHAYETNCGDGGRRLSGGQQQRITLARAILRDPDILVLDEASSQIDPKSQQLISESLKEFIRSRTTIMITHRMSTLDLADRILVLEGGKVLDMGTHEELMDRCPHYQNLRRIPLRKSA